MGCDIHEYFEIWREASWVKVEVLPKLDWDSSTPEEEEAYWSLPLFIECDYDFFAVLAGVRNVLGIRPISPCRGVPEDLSDQVREEWRRVQGYPEVHSASWISYGFELN